MRFSERDYNEEFRALVESDLEANRIGATTIRENLERSPLWYDGRLTIETLQVPKILTETTVFTFEHIRQRFERTLVGTMNCLATAAVVEERIDSFLKHAFFVADDDFGCIQLDESFETVVAVDDAAIQIVEI